MTFSIAGRCARTGMFGLGIATSSIAVGSRCIFARAKVGAVLTQHRTDPRLGPRGLELLSSGCSAADTVSALVASTPHREWRQIAVIDSEGRTGHFTGARNGPLVATANGRDCISIGNILRAVEVPTAMSTTFEQLADAPLAERLLAALSAGETAGGEIRPLKSAALLVVHQLSFPFVDLRVDRDSQPIVALASLWQEYQPTAGDYVARALDPDSV